MTIPEMQAAIKMLELFNEKNEELRTSSFADAIFGDSGVDLSYKAGKGTKVKRRGPNNESIQAWAPHLREPTALEFIEQFIYGDILHLDEEKRENFVNWRKDEVVFAFAQNRYCVLCSGLITAAVDLMNCNDYALPILNQWIAAQQKTG